MTSTRPHRTRRPQPARPTRPRVERVRPRQRRRHHPVRRQVELRDQPGHHRADRFPPGTGLPLHSHNVEESVLVFEGEATAVIGDDEFDLVAGQATWVPAGVPHCFCNRGDGPMRIYWVYGGRDVTRTITATGETFEHLSESDRGGRHPHDRRSTTVNPATGEPLADYPVFADADVDAALAEAAEAARRGRSCACGDGRSLDSLRGRRHPARRARDARRAGHPGDGQAARRVPRRGREVCGHGPTTTPSTPRDFLADEPVDLGRRRSWISYEPVGLVLAVMPWNFPLWQVMRFAAPGAHGRQRRAPQALAEHHRLRARGAGAAGRGRAARRGVHAPSSSRSPTSPRSPRG